MASAEIVLFIKTFALISAFLMVGTFLRAKIKLFQKLFLPACVIGGAIALLLGPKVLGILPIPDEIMTTASNLPGKLFGIVIACLPMGAAKLKKGELKSRFDAINIALIITMLGAAQFALGFLVNVIFNAIGTPLYAGYGSEMFMGYCGGHGIASMIGSIFEGLGQDYAEIATGVGQTFATIGMVCGILLGVFVLNRGARKGQTNYVKNPSILPKEMLMGLYHDIENQPSAGRQTTAGGSIDTLALHFGFIMTDVGIGYIINDFVKANSIPILKDQDAWLFMLFAMYILWAIVRALGWDRYFDSNIKSKIQGCITDFVVAAAIMSMPIAVILDYWKPILITALLGFIITVPSILVLNKYYMHEDWLEKSMGPIGMMTGDFITGVMLTRMVDPDLKSNALPDFSIAYALNTIYCVAMLSFVYPYVVNNGAWKAFLLCMAQAVVLGVVLFFFGRFSRKSKQA